MEKCDKHCCLKSRVLTCSHVYLVEPEPADQPFIGIRTPLVKMARDNTIVSNDTNFNLISVNLIKSDSPCLLRQAKELSFINPDRSLNALHFRTVEHPLVIRINKKGEYSLFNMYLSHFICGVCDLFLNVL